MNQKEVGKFISKIRKEKKLTQEELANILGVTDRAISKWENGRGMPDISLLKPLSNALDISVNELLSGSRIKDKDFKNVSDENIIEYLVDSERKSKKIQRITISIMLIIFIILFVLIDYYKSIHPKFDISSIELNREDDENNYKFYKKFNYNNREVYYYGINDFKLCSIKDECYEIENALKNNQITINSLKDYLDKKENIIVNRLWDGGTSIYETEGYAVIICDRLDNKDIYIGDSKLLDYLNGGFCGYEVDTLKFKKIYHIEKIEELKNEKVKIKINDLNDNSEEVIISKRYDLIVGRNYEFTFYTFDKFNDNIKNIFNYSTIDKVKLLDDIREGKNEKIVINDNNKNRKFSGVKNIFLELENITERSAKLVITDYSQDMYVYGSDYYIEKNINGTWKKLDYIHDDIAFNAMAYHKDINNKLIFNLNWEYAYGKLEKGKYRVVKRIFLELERAVTEKDVINVYGEFEIK